MSCLKNLDQLFEITVVAQYVARFKLRGPDGEDKFVEQVVGKGKDDVFELNLNVTEGVEL